MEFSVSTRTSLQKTDKKILGYSFLFLSSTMKEKHLNIFFIASSLLFDNIVAGKHAIFVLFFRRFQRKFVYEEVFSELEYSITSQCGTFSSKTWTKLNTENQMPKC